MDMPEKSTEEMFMLILNQAKENTTLFLLELSEEGKGDTLTIDDVKRQLRYSMSELTERLRYRIDQDPYDIAYDSRVMLKDLVKHMEYFLKHSLFDEAAQDIWVTLFDRLVG